MKNNTICSQAFQEVWKKTVLFVQHICRDYRTALTWSGNMLLFIIKWCSSRTSTEAAAPVHLRGLRIGSQSWLSTSILSFAIALMHFWKGAVTWLPKYKNKQRKDTFDVWILPDRVQYPYCFSFVTFSLLLWNFWKNNINSVESAIQFLHSVTWQNCGSVDVVFWYTL